MLCERAMLSKIRLRKKKRKQGIERGRPVELKLSPVEVRHVAQFRKEDKSDGARWVVDRAIDRARACVRSFDGLTRGMTANNARTWLAKSNRIRTAARRSRPRLLLRRCRSVGCGFRIF